MTQNIDSYFEDEKGFRSNPFRKGYLTDEERKQPFRWFGDNFVFFAKHADLSDTGVEIYRNENYSYANGPLPRTWEAALLRDCMIFGMWWRENVHKYLNGFMGFDCIKVEIDPALNMNLRFNMNTENKNKDLCKTCEHYWQDFPLPLDHVESHCEIVDKKYGLSADMDSEVPYPCLECPFNCYIKKK